MWDIVWVSPQGHRSVSVSCQLSLNTETDMDIETDIESRDLTGIVSKGNGR